MRDADHSRARHANPSTLWRTFTGISIAHEAMAAIEKPIVARVNGDAVGTGASVLFNCDLAVAVEDTLIADHHLSMGELEKWGTTFGMVPGDGGLALAPLHMPPMKVKEFLMLAEPYSAKEFAEQGIINYAVPAETSTLSSTTSSPACSPVPPMRWRGPSGSRIARRSPT